jgi:asparagine synthase (glutamine-hydrolysing)
MQPAITGTVDDDTGHYGHSTARLAGLINLDQLDAQSKPTVFSAQGGKSRIEFPGFEVTLDPTVDWHVEDGKVVLLQGQPVIDAKRVRASDVVSMTQASSGEPLPLGGRYAAIVIDRLDRSVLLQTDRYGVWPLCWSQAGDRVSFADRADAATIGNAAAIDPQALFDYVYFHMIPAPRTVFRDVSRLEPAMALRVSRKGVSAKPAWQPQFSQRRHGDIGDLRRRFRDAITNAVKSEVGTDSVGCFLSGGTDSSTVAGTLKQVAGHAATFSIGFDAAGYDEMEYARIAAKHFGTDHHEHYVTPAELVSGIPNVASHYDQPFGNSSAVPAYICALMARDHGVQKLLAGDGGDELFGGNTRYAKQKIFEAWWHLPQAVRAGTSPLIANRLTRGLPLLRKAASYVDQASVPMPARMETYNLLKRFGPTEVFTPAFLASINTKSPESLQSEVYHRQQTSPFVDRMLAYDWRFTLSDNDLPKVSGTTRLAGIGVGYPLLADALVDVSTALGARDKVLGLRLRHFFKESLTDFLPPEIIAKKKHGFGLPVGVWLVRDKAFRELARSSLAQLGERRLIQASLVDDLFSRRLEEHPGYYGEMVWILIMLEQWLEFHAPTWTVP